MDPDQHRVAQNITADYEDLPNLEEMVAFVLHNYTLNNGHVVTETCYVRSVAHI